MRASVLLVVLSTGCSSKPTTEAPAPSGSATAEVAAPSTSKVGSMPPPPKPGLQLLKFTFARGVKHKDPLEPLREASPGDRVYAHFAVRNRGGPQKLHVVFYVGSDERTTLDLLVEHSWSYRTWAYNTLRAADHGQLRVVATDETGQTLVDEKLPIVPRK